MLVDIAALRIEVVIPSNDLRDSDMAGLTLSDAVTCIVRLQCVDVALFGKTQVGTGLREVSAVGLQIILIEQRVCRDIMRDADLVAIIACLNGVCVGARGWSSSRRSGICSVLRDWRWTCVGVV